jgi:hypothetical protein
VEHLFGAPPFLTSNIRLSRTQLLVYLSGALERKKGGGGFHAFWPKTIRPIGILPTRTVDLIIQLLAK